MKKPVFNQLWENYMNGWYKDASRIGETIDFIRYGDIPKDGKSTWWHTLAPPYKSYPKLDGLSVFEINNGVPIIPHPELYTSPCFFERSVYLGKGIIVRIGPDKEPLVKVLSIKRASSEEENPRTSP